MTVPTVPKIYHITRIDNLASIVADGCLWSDADMVQRIDQPASIGMQGIKTARLTMPVACYLEIFVGQCVPFNFCPRSVMLNLIYYANHSHLTYRGGQQPIVHLEADLRQAVQWAEDNQRLWTFSLANARGAYTEFRARLDELEEINWDAIAAKDFRPADIKEAKQAEFLVQQSFPWRLVERIGVHSQGTVSRVSGAMHGAAHRPGIEIRREWYY